MHYMDSTTSVLAGGALGATAGYFLLPKYKMVAAIGGGFAGAIAGMMLSASAASAAPQIGPAPPPPPPSLPILQPIDLSAPAGSRTFIAQIQNSTSSVQMAMGDKLQIQLPAASRGTAPGGWFYFNADGTPSGGYQGLSFNGRTTSAPNLATGDVFTADNYTATASLGGNVVQVIAKLLPLDSSGNAVPNSIASATFILWVGVS